ncbi:hypothetical protein FF011L_45120 [Roseimaritima multifibrata]|uniref:DUF1501 domain-containing protein n=1 Tax=Roseimaritima multifibrata TaxID=1930274 RepID=A0A517MLF6_9BACT|nr:DUF1501 domain-containing protein [Roseimaritima multifibrata]QDS95712.1 hypothetical protein FF011L_45120 [Roseimaritima multifibrata]
MLPFPKSGAPRYHLDRRGFLRMGTMGVIGTAVPRSFAQASPKSPEGFGKAKSVLIVMLSGGPSQLDMLDPKPDAPAEVRGDFSTIGTTIPGVRVCEHLPLFAKQTDRWSIVRTLAHREHNHLLATHVALTGRPTPVPRGGSDLDRVETRNDFPNFAAALDYVRPRNDGVPTGVSLPNYLIEGPLTWPGQHAGFLGAKHDPWQIQGNPNAADFRMQALAMREGITPVRLESRRELLEALNQGRRTLTGTDSDSFRDQQNIAFNLLTSGKMTEAFEISQESDATRDRYGRNQFGQSLLLSRRMVEAGVPIVQATMGIVQTWDTHTDNWGKLKDRLLPQLDQGLAALTDDLTESGLMDQTMVIVMGEFGRTPRVSTLPGQTLPGRDHWAHAYSGLFAGAGVRGGQVLGTTDAQAAYPVTQSWSPADVCSTIFNALGIDHDVRINDRLNRPHDLLNGIPITSLYTGQKA